MLKTRARHVIVTGNALYFNSNGDREGRYQLAVYHDLDRPRYYLGDTSQWGITGGCHDLPHGPSEALIGLLDAFTPDWGTLYG